MSLVTVKLYGKLGKLFGEEYQLAIRTPGEAIRALGSQLNGFLQFLRDAESEGTAFRVRLDNREIMILDELVMNVDSCVEIYPLPIGAKSAGTFQIILGVVLIAAAVVTWGASASALSFGATLGTSGALGTSVTFLTMMGASMIIGGLAAMLSAPKANKLNSNSEENRRSYLFDGAVSAARQGGPVPVGYGTLHIGPHIVSIGINTEALTEDLSAAPSEDSNGIYIYAKGSKVYYKASL